MITIYTIATCPYCHRATELLKSKNIPYNQIDLTNKPTERAALAEKANGRTSVPQIFLNETLLGGCDDLYQLEKEGKLDKLFETELHRKP